MRATWLEPHDQFEGVGAHELNRRYDWCDEGEHDEEIVAVPDTLPALFQARAMLAASSRPIRFDGADISHHQYDAGPVHLTDLAGASWWLAFKLTQSTSYTDPTAARTRSAAQAAGFRHRGLYHQGIPVRASPNDLGGLHVRGQGTGPAWAQGEPLALLAVQQQRASHRHYRAL
jgi:hypothetical protein